MSHTNQVARRWFLRQCGVGLGSMALSQLLGAAAAVFGELEPGAEELGIGINEGRAVTLEKIGRRQRAVEFGELRLIVEHLQVAGRAGHEQEDDVLGLRRKMRLPRCTRVVRGSVSALLEERVQRDGAQSNAALLQKPPA